MISRQLLIATAVLFLAAAALSLYVLRLRRHEAQVPRPAATPLHPEPPSAGPAEKVTIWVVHDDSGTLRPQTASIPLTGGRQQRAVALMRALLDVYGAKDSPHPMPAGADIRALYLVDPGIAVIDINAGFAAGQTSGVLAEDLMIASLIETLSANTPGLQRVKILVDGKDAATLAGHADLSSFYEVTQIDELARQLASQ